MNIQRNVSYLHLGRLGITSKRDSSKDISCTQKFSLTIRPDVRKMGKIVFLFLTSSDS